MAKDRLRWGILGTGLIAHELADGVRLSETGMLVAVGSRELDRARAFAAEFSMPHAFGSYQEVLEDPEVDAVYIALPHPMHCAWALRCAEAGKHILVEKPIGMTLTETLAMIDTAQAHDVFLMEAFMYRCHPQMTRLVQLIQEGALGQVQLVRASFSYRGSDDPLNRTLNPELGGGGILDVGCYPVSISRLIAGATLGRAFAEPVVVQGCGHVGATGVDEWAIANLKFENDLVAQCATGIRLNQHHDNIVEIFGTKAKLTVPDPWCPSRFNRDPARLILQRHPDDVEEVVLVEASRDLYTYEADMVACHLEARQAPAMSWVDSCGNQRVLDHWRAQVGVVYPLEQRAAMTRTTFRGTPLRVREPRMQYGELAGLGKPVSRLVMGADSNSAHDTALLFDAWFELGGNAFDTSSAYGIPQGACERNLGQWIERRGIRDQVVVIEKGANAPNDSPEGLSRDFETGLDRLQLDAVDIYMIHRDNPAVPVGEWVAVLNEHLRWGHMKVFGLSNFSIPRLEAFQDYARTHGLQSFSMVSNQCSLARVQAPIWDCYLVSSSGSADRAWFERHQIPLFPWSSQARGFFTDRAGRDRLEDAELVRCWYEETNFQRRERAGELARQKGVEPINIALAWVLAQPFPTFPLVGPKRLREIHSTIAALEVKLTPQEVAWLDLES